MVTATPNLTFTFLDAGQAAKKVIATRLAFGKVLISAPSATTLVSTVRWLPFATKWRKPVSSRDKNSAAYSHVPPSTDWRRVPIVKAPAQTGVANSPVGDGRPR